VSAQSAGGAIWLDPTSREVVAPNGPGAASALTGWESSGVGRGRYEVALVGAAAIGTCSCPVCPADFNADGGVDGADVEAFFRTWATGESCGDVNADGGVDGADIESFFLVWAVGGCEG
jgi:hypothetical protein